MTNKEELIAAIADTEKKVGGRSWEIAVDNEFYLPDNSESECLGIKFLRTISESGYQFEELGRYGGEGEILHIEEMGEEYYVVFQVTAPTWKSAFKLDGWYQSYNGHEFEDCYDFYEVEEKEVLVKQWCPKENS